MNKKLEPVYELALNSRIVEKAERKLLKQSEFMCLRELIDDLLDKWVKGEIE